MSNKEIKEKTNELMGNAKAGNEEAIAAIIYYNKGLILKIINKFSFPSDSYRVDLIQTAKLGMLIAIRDYDSSFGVEFCTFAYVCIRNEVIKERRNHNYLEVPKNIISIATEVKAMLDKYYMITGKILSKDVIINECRISEETYEKIMLYLNTTQISFEEPAFSPKAHEEGKQQKIDEFIGEYADYGYFELEQTFHKLISSLPEKERKILELVCLHGMNTKEAAPLVGLTKRSADIYLLRGRQKVRAGLISDTIIKKEVS